MIDNNIDTGALSIWTVYDHPSDWPDYFVARRHLVPGGPTDNIMVAKDLDALRETMESVGLVKMHRSAADEPTIIESWL